MANGEALQAMIRAHEITHDQKYLEIAKLLLNSFFVEVKDGGVTFKDNYGWWYEEYAHAEGKNSRVLNGMIYALIGINDYFEYTNDPDAKYLFDKGISALKHDIALYDAEHFTYYDILKRPASIKYHNVHVKYLAELLEIANDPLLREYHDKWAAYNVAPPFVPITYLKLFAVSLSIGEGIFFIVYAISRITKTRSSRS
jgi:hypothetical protein